VRERLVTVATRLFAERGFESTSVQEIVEAAGVTKGAMYHYYGSKDDLLYEVYHRLLTMQTARMVAIADGGGTAEERLRRAAADVVQTSLANLDDMNVFFRSMHMLPPDQRAKVRSERRGYHDRFRALVDEGIEAGTFRGDIPADVHVQYFLSAVNQMGTWFKPGGPLTATRVSECFTDLLLAGLRP
jgi:AcrR family transcriptional regulator